MLLGILTLCVLYGLPLVTPVSAADLTSRQLTHLTHSDLDTEDGHGKTDLLHILRTLAEYTRQKKYNEEASLSRKDNGVSKMASMDTKAMERRANKVTSRGQHPDSSTDLIGARQILRQLLTKAASDSSSHGLINSRTDLVTQLEEIRNQGSRDTQEHEQKHAQYIETLKSYLQRALEDITNDVNGTEQTNQIDTDTSEKLHTTSGNDVSASGQPLDNGHENTIVQQNNTGNEVTDVSSISQPADNGHTNISTTQHSETGNEVTDASAFTSPIDSSHGNASIAEETNAANVNEDLDTSSQELTPYPSSEVHEVQHEVHTGEVSPDLEVFKLRPSGGSGVKNPEDVLMLELESLQVIEKLLRRVIAELYAQLESMVDKEVEEEQQLEQDMQRKVAKRKKAKSKNKSKESKEKNKSNESKGSMEKEGGKSKGKNKSGGTAGGAEGQEEEGENQEEEEEEEEEDEEGAGEEQEEDILPETTAIPVTRTLEVVSESGTVNEAPDSDDVTSETPTQIHEEENNPKVITSGSHDDVSAVPQDDITTARPRPTEVEVDPAAPPSDLTTAGSVDESKPATKPSNSERNELISEILELLEKLLNDVKK